MLPNSLKSLKVGDKVLVSASLGMRYETVITRETPTLFVAENNVRFMKKDLFGYGHKAYIKAVV